ncbi:MAG: hypothetical protein ACLSVD_06785 [Eggerthellaceae bacterium]
MPGALAPSCSPSPSARPRRAHRAVAAVLAIGATVVAWWRNNNMTEPPRTRRRCWIASKTRSRHE